jgi:hypothetical protein
MKWFIFPDAACIDDLEDEKVSERKGNLVLFAEVGFLFLSSG